ncbi:MAG TPA: hypothetical protein VFZ65_21410 [Planctomycetota bacterium]|nr:hypothetical protein [Planctomycetota bacterium]
MRNWAQLCLLPALAAALPSQGHHAVGKYDVAWTNTTGVGNATLTARVHYPALIGGYQAPIAPSPAGWPVVVFLHGYSLVGQDYSALGDAWATAGFVVVLSDTAQWNYLEQEADGWALYDAVVSANTQQGFFAGAFDTTRIALAGHSMGGGSIGSVLASNPGYACGLALAPVAPPATTAAQVRVPFGIVVGTGDVITPFFQFAQPYFEALGSSNGLKFLYLMNDDCEHMNVAGLGTSQVTPVFERSSELGLGFLSHFMRLGITGLDNVVGPPALAEPRLIRLSQEVSVPQVWAAGPLQIGVTTRLSVIAEPGLAGILAAFSLGPGIPTSIGVLNLDPLSAFTLAAMPVDSHNRLDAFVQIPNVPALVGLPIALQAVGATALSPLWLGSTLQLSVE